MLRDNIMKYKGCSYEEIIHSYKQRLEEYNRKVAEGHIFIGYEHGKKNIPLELKRERDAVLNHYGFEVPRQE